MDFGLSEEQRDIQALSRRILGDLSTPAKLATYDNWAGERFDRELWAKLAEAGLLGVGAPEDAGGMGFGFMEAGLLAEECGRRIAAVPLVSHLAGGILPLVKFGTAEQRARLLSGAVSGELLLTAALEEGPAGDASAPATIAVADGDGYRLSGTRFAVPYGAQAERVLLGARSGEGVIAVWLDPRAAGVRLDQLHDTAYEPQCTLTMDQVMVAAADVLAGPEAGAAVLAEVARHLTAAICMHQVGVTDTLMRMTASYTSERKQFGVPVATFQAVGHRAANCFIDVECLRLTAYEACSLLAEGRLAAVEVDIAKVWAGDTGHRVSYAAQHLHGGAGVDRGNALWRYCQWARHNEMTLGSSAQTLARLGRRCASGEALVS
jgi:alkylation response protein AidB-like acyl-CoA dehydrogenase